RVRNARAVWCIVSFGDNFSVSCHQQTVKTVHRAEVNQLSELLRIHSLLFWRGALPLLRWPDWLCCVLSWSSPIANCGCNRECAQRSRQETQFVSPCIMQPKFLRTNFHIGARLLSLLVELSHQL